MLDDRFWQYVEKEEDGCWLWIGAKTQTGYGQFCPTGKNTTSAHRVSYEAQVGEIPEGYDVDHLCKVRNCVNPEHLEAITHRENLLRSPTTFAAINAAKTHCPQGHPYNKENTHITKQNRRYCKICKRQQSLAYYHRNKHKQQGDTK